MKRSARKDRHNGAKQEEERYVEERKRQIKSLFIELRQSDEAQDSHGDDDSSRYSYKRCEKCARCEEENPREQKATSGKNVAVDFVW